MIFLGVVQLNLEPLNIAGYLPWDTCIVFGMQMKLPEFTIFLTKVNI